MGYSLSLPILKNNDPLPIFDINNPSYEPQILVISCRIIPGNKSEEKRVFFISCKK